MEDVENWGKNYLKAISEEIKTTIVREEIEKVPVMCVDPDLVIRLIKNMQAKGVNQVKYGNESRTVNPELAREFAHAARNILRFTIKELVDQGILLISGRNWGSTAIGLVTPKSDIDIQLDLASIPDLETAGQFLRFNQRFQNGLWKIPACTIVPSVEYSLGVPSADKEQPSEKWIHTAQDKIKITPQR